MGIESLPTAEWELGRGDSGGTTFTERVKSPKTGRSREKIQPRKTISVAVRGGKEES